MVIQHIFSQHKLHNSTIISIKKTNQTHQSFYQLVVAMKRKTMPRNKVAPVLVHQQPEPEVVEHQHCQCHGEPPHMEEHSRLHRRRLSFHQIDNHDKVLDVPTRIHPPLDHRLDRVSPLQRRNMMNTNSHHAPHEQGTNCKLHLPCCQSKLTAQDWIGPTTTKKCIYETENKLTMKHSTPITVLSPHLFYLSGSPCLSLTSFFVSHVSIIWHLLHHTWWNVTKKKLNICLFHQHTNNLINPLPITQTQGRGGGRVGGGGIRPSNVCSSGGGGTVSHSSRRARGGIGPWWRIPTISARSMKDKATSGIASSGNRKDNGIWPPPNATG